MLKVITSLLIVALGPISALAYVASSTNYRLQLDSVNVGGLYSTSTNYRIEDTVGEVATGFGTSTTYNLSAGYQQFESAAATTITISAPANVTLSPNISDATGGTANGAASWTVTTNNAAGYTLTIAAAASPALISGSHSFTDYSPAGADPDFAFTVGAAQSFFGFSPEGNDLVASFKDDGLACNAGAGDTGSACWDGLSTTPTTIAQSAAANNPTGTITTVRFRAAAGASKSQPSGAYAATITMTATVI